MTYIRARRVATAIRYEQKKNGVMICNDIHNSIHTYIHPVVRSIETPDLISYCFVPPGPRKGDQATAQILACRLQSNE